jgi:hypothetical protein
MHLATQDAHLLNFQVKAIDDDPDENGQVTYSKLIGDETVENSFLLDPFTGKVSIKDNHLLDREVAEGTLQKNELKISTDIKSNVC